MSLTKVTIDDVDSVRPEDEYIPPGATADAVAAGRPLSAQLETEHVAVNHYTLAPGESLWISVHRHEAQEELFYVTTGTITFESPSDELSVHAGEVVRVPPRTLQLGTNHGETAAAALAIGAPREYEATTELVVSCATCEAETIHTITEAEEAEALIYECTACSGETYRAARE